MNQLVRLTEALRGNYTLEDSNEYDVWSEWAERQNELEDAQSKREQRAIRQQLRDFSREQNPGLQVEDELEAMHDSLIAKPKEVDAQVEQDATEEDPEEEDFGAQFYAQRKVVGATRASASKTQIQEEIDVAPDVEENIYSPGLDSNAESDDDDFDGDEFRAKRRRRKSSNQRKKRTKEKSSAQPAPSVAHKSAKRNAPTSDDIRDTSIASEAEKDHSKKAKVEKSMPTEDEKPAARKSPPESNEVATTSQTAERQSSPAAKSATATAARKPSSAPKSLKTRPLKKCHDCKKQSNKYRNCNYWKLSGNKCGKAFCTNCLSSKYSLGNDVLSPSNPSGIPIDEIVMCVALDVEWHCPSCLGSCQCSTCVKLRKKEEEREKSRLEASSRKSSRRSAAHLSGYFNFM